MESSRSELGAGSFRVTHDIVGSLPPELLLLIVEKLDPADIVRSQRVSKRWQSIFSSNAITMFALRQTLAFLDIDDTDIPASDAMTYFRWRHGLQCVRPVKRMFLPWSDPPKKPTRIAYHSRRLCYHLGIAGHVEILDLETGERSVWIEDEALGHECFDLQMSDRYVVIIANNRALIALDTATSQRYARELPCSVHDIFIENDKVIIVDFESKPLFPIYIWNLSSDSFQKINSFANLCLWHVDLDDDILVAIEIDWSKHPPRVQQTNWTLNGELLDRTHFPLSLLDRRADRQVTEPLEGLVELRNNTSRTYGRKSVRNLPYRDPSHGCCPIFLVYDYAIDKLSATWYDWAPPIFDGPNSLFFTILTSKMAYTWNCASKRLVFIDNERDVAFVQPYQLDARELNVRKRSATNSELLLLVFGDREVFGVASEDGLQFLFFNPNFTPDIPEVQPFLAMEESG